MIIWRNIEMCREDSPSSNNLDGYYQDSHGDLRQNVESADTPCVTEKGFPPPLPQRDSDTVAVNCNSHASAIPFKVPVA